MKQHVLIRFGKWQEIIDQPLPDDPALYCVDHRDDPLHPLRRPCRDRPRRRGRGRARPVLRGACARVPETRRCSTTPPSTSWRSPSRCCWASWSTGKGNYDAAFDHLRRSVEIDDHLPYDEPWGWMQPTRHALGALLLEQGRDEEAEAVYRADLGLDDTLRRPCQHPDNVWSLHGLHECLVRRGERAEAARHQAAPGPCRRPRRRADQGVVLLPAAARGLESPHPPTPSARVPPSPASRARGFWRDRCHKPLSRLREREGPAAKRWEGEGQSFSRSLS